MRAPRLKNLCQSAVNICKSTLGRKTLQYITLASLAGLATQAFGTDLLSGTETSLLDTLKGTGKKYLYIAECVVSLLVYIQTKNVMVLVGIIVVAIFFNIMLTMAA